MDIRYSESGPITVVGIEGSVDSLTADRLTESLEAKLREGRVRLVADFSQVSYTSSAGLRSLLAAVKDARQRGGDLRLAAVQPQVQRVLSLAGFTSIIRVFDDVPAAVDSYGVAA
ncbi:STAS domain-containing protein [Ramlibacter rhizophilus]|uniref:Anti-sigma factor antagonist n=1 Tax=Ramlibacter rhizophilus TaxID=1781167 RepID=A0A4Z0BBF0_9BURK|nr:STAS domain-containing protein [Ramlibacter rhizophilus]TFY96455.1 anti-sigma factor antagonist [Ramlibacter rhizophilus]